MRNLILGVARPPLRLLGRDDRGALGVLVAMMLGAGVLTGMGALVIDVGQLYQERAELQNGADAASLAVANSCAVSACTPASAASIALTYASQNNHHGLAAVGQVCGSGGTLVACSASTGATTDCPAVPPNGTNYVDVHTSTKTSTGTVITPIFAPSLLGNSNYQGTTVLACSQAEWGAPATATVTALTISACEWDYETSQGTVYAQSPPYPPNTTPASSVDRVLIPSNSDDGCGSEPANADTAKSFGWTADPGSTCSLTISSSPFAAPAGGPGAPISTACKTVLAAAQSTKKPIAVPVYIAATNESGWTYTLKGFAAFVVTGYYLYGSPTFSASDWLKSANNCSGTSSCINGYFIKGIIPYTGSLGGTYLGANVIKISG